MPSNALRGALLLPDVKHRVSRYLNKHADTPIGPTCRWEPQMQRLKSPDRAQGFSGTHHRLRKLQATASSPKCHRLSACSDQNVPELTKQTLCAAERIWLGRAGIISLLLFRKRITWQCQREGVKGGHRQRKHSMPALSITDQ
jgi:hypothetical protein